PARDEHALRGPEGKGRVDARAEQRGRKHGARGYAGRRRAAAGSPGGWRRLSGGGQIGGLMKLRTLGVALLLVTAVARPAVAQRYSARRPGDVGRLRDTTRRV